LRCPYCAAEEDKVVDSRIAEEGRSIRRRRECLTCGRRFTTFERPEEVPLLVIKRDRSEVPFDREKVIEGIRHATKNRPVTEAEIESLADDVEESMRVDGRRPVETAVIGREVLERLRFLDEVAYLRFASVYKDFQELNDFEQEMGILLKRSPPKERTSETEEPEV
jgi:transcriptional repressor NrdR